MKEKLFLLMLSLILLFDSCAEKSHSVDYDFEYIRSVEVITPKSDEVKIDNFAKKITIWFPANTKVDAVEIKFNLGKDVVIEGNKNTYDLTKPMILELNHKNKLVRFQLISNFSSFVFNPTNKSWEKDETFGELPKYISVYKSNKVVNGKKILAYIAAVDMDDKGAPKFGVIGNASGVKTPSQFYDSNEKPKIVLNGGYFWDGHSLGLIIRDGVTINQAQPMAYRTYNNQSTVYYPTQGIFGRNQNGDFETHWAYSSNNTLFVYPQPAANKAGEKPMPTPSDKYPDGATVWKPIDAIGAGPILIKKGEYKNIWEAEMFDNLSGIAPTSNHPRTAIGFTESRHLVFFVCEGRNMTPSIPGLTLKEVSDLLLEIGCVEALNLDGGGSSCMLINGKETIKPSDGKQRTVTSVVSIK